MRRFFLCLLLVLLSLPALALSSRGHVRVHRRHWWSFHREKVAFPPSHLSLILQNRWIEQMGLQRFEDETDLSEAASGGEVVPILENQYVICAKTLPVNRRLVRPWVNDFLQDLGSAFYERFHKPIQVNSAVRTMEVQRRLRRWNKNAAPVDGETASSHEAGATIDLQRRGLNKAQIHFVEWKLLILYGYGKVLEEEELRQPCFHTMVSRNYRKDPVELIDIPYVDTELNPEIAGIR